MSFWSTASTFFDKFGEHKMAAVGVTAAVAVGVSIFLTLYLINLAVGLAIKAMIAFAIIYAIEKATGLKLTEPIINAVCQLPRYARNLANSEIVNTIVGLFGSLKGVLGIAALDNKTTANNEAGDDLSQTTQGLQSPP